MIDRFPRVGFTGSQMGMVKRQQEALKAVLALLTPGWFHHGDCVGADVEAGTMALALGWQVSLHPPSHSAKRAFAPHQETHRELPYLQRNHVMVEVTSLLLAGPRTYVETLRSGTWATVRHARKKGRPVVIVNPSGRLTAERCPEVLTEALKTLDPDVYTSRLP